jgi:hypothetical protein
VSKGYSLMAGTRGGGQNSKRGGPAVGRSARPKRRRRTGGLPVTWRGGGRRAWRRELHDVLG